MFIVHVAPLQKRGVATLTYFSAGELPVGSIVQIPIRTRTAPALVLECNDAKAMKAALRSNVYEMKKLPSQEPRRICDDAFILAARSTSDEYATSLGAVIESYIPKAILSNDKTYTEVVHQPMQEVKAFEKCALQLPSSERAETYQTLIRSNFAQNASTFFCVPTTREARALGRACKHEGIQDYVYVLESSQTPKKQQEVWASILSESHPVVVIATPTFISIPRSDVGMYIIEHENASSFKQQRSPYVDARILVEKLAAARASTLVYADTVLSTRVHRALEDGFVREIEGHVRKLRTNNTVSLIDVHTARTQAKEDTLPFPVVTTEALEALRTEHARIQRSFVFAPRRGIASHTICNDCGTPVRCSSCKSPLTLHEMRAGRQLLCHRCGTTANADTRCTTCDSWNLVPLGIGIERVAEYIRVHMEDVPLFIISGDATRTPKQARAVAKEFYATPGAILIGTEMALSYLTEPVSTSVLCSLDSLLSIPDFRIEEKIFRILATLRERTVSTVFIETSQPNNEMLAYAQQGALDSYIKHELALRKQLNYPPYSRLVQVSCRGTREKVIGDMQVFIERAASYTPRVFRGFIPRGRDLELRALIRVPSSSWPDETLVSLLRSLPLSCTVTIDPDRVL